MFGPPPLCLLSTLVSTPADAAAAAAALPPPFCNERCCSLSAREILADVQCYVSRVHVNSNAFGACSGAFMCYVSRATLVLPHAIPFRTAAY
eukprot:1136471-Pelagomonas_calceolata.AAC.5